MQPRLNIALKACRSAAEIINTVYKTKNQDDLRSYDHFDQLLYMHIIESISESYPFNGIDCSALIQIYFYYNRIFFPRDTKDQIKFCKKKISKKIDKGDIIFWKGHVGMSINQLNFIHAYGPRKKVLIMPTKHTIKLISKTANLSVKKITNIKNY